MDHGIVVISVLAVQCLLAGLIYLLTSRACRGENRPLLVRVAANVAASFLVLVASWLGVVSLLSPILGGAMDFFSIIPHMTFWLRII